MNKPYTNITPPKESISTNLVFIKHLKSEMKADMYIGKIAGGNDTVTIHIPALKISISVATEQILKSLE